MRLLRFLLALAAASAPSLATAQQTRAEQLEQLRAEKAKTLTPYKPGRLEAIALWIEDRRVVERFSSGLTGLYPRIGGLPTGSGFALGATFRVSQPDPKFVFEATGAASFKGYKQLDLSARLPRLAGDRLELTGGIGWWDYTQMRFYGLGADSKPEDRASYRYEATHAQGVARFRVTPWFSVGDEFGYLNSNIRSGTDSRYPSIDETFTDAEAPGLERPPNLAYTRLFFDVDYRDQPDNTRGGGRYLLEWGVGYDQSAGGEFNYRRTDLFVEQVFPIFDKKRNFALLFRAAHVDPLHADGRVPFFLSPTIGGATTLRSYAEERFRAPTFVLFNGEYRWEGFSSLDLALFFDAGEVGDRLQDITLKDVKTGFGFGLRFNTTKAVFMRIDFGFGGPEGNRVFFKFGPAF
jgi:outer membrane protein assembly factor BamA